MGQAAETSKHDRMMEMLMRFTNGEVLRKIDLADEFGVNTRSIQRDLDDLRAFLSDRKTSDGSTQEIVYDHAQKGFRMKVSSGTTLTDGETLTVCKILLESRSLRKDEMFPILEKLIHNCVPLPSQKRAAELISNEKHLYIEPHHEQPLIDRIWEIGQAVREQRYMVIEYKKLKEHEPVSRLVKPVGIMFSEFYFYLTAFIEHRDGGNRQQTPFPTIYRIDRLLGLRILDEHFQVPYKDRFQEGEFRKRIQFMYGGELRTVRFRYCGASIEAVLDRFPTAKILEEKDGVYTIEAEVYGSGVDMWLRSQGDAVEVI